MLGLRDRRPIGEDVEAVAIGESTSVEPPEGVVEERSTTVDPDGAPPGGLPGDPRTAQAVAYAIVTGRERAIAPGEQHLVSRSSEEPVVNARRLPEADIATLAAAYWAAHPELETLEWWAENYQPVAP